MENKELITKNKNTNPHLVEMHSSVENNAPGWCEAVPRAGYSDRLNLSG